MDESLDAQVAAVAALSEPTRRQVFDYVAAQTAPVGRDAVGAALDLSRAAAAFHLDKLAQERLLDVEFQRLSGRSGPGAGRPAKLYRRSDRQLDVSMPQRQYEFAAQLLADSIAESPLTGEPPQAVLHRRAFAAGRDLGEATPGDPELAAEQQVLDGLRRYGFEPRVVDQGIVLSSCPFHTLAQRNPALMCGMNLHLVQGLLAGMGATELKPVLAPGPRACCVRLDRTG